MTSITLKFRPSSLKHHQGSLYFQIIRDRKIRSLPTGCKIYPSEWDSARSNFTSKVGSRRRDDIISIRKHLSINTRRLIKIDRQLESSHIYYTPDDIIREYREYLNRISLFGCMERTIVRMKDSGRIRTSETYSSTLNSFRRFRNNIDLPLDELTPEIMESYEIWLRQKGVVSNTVSFYNRILRAVYNRAVASGLIENLYPFQHVYTGIDRTIKRALTLSKIKKIKSLDLEAVPMADYARDIFLLSFMLRGMSFIDMAFLKKENLKNGRISYCRRKTGRRISIRWTEEMQRILDKYPSNPTDYLLPIICHKEDNDYYAYRAASYSINHHLKKIASMAGISAPLTLYCARHSWASAAHSRGIPVSIISQGMGHDRESTTHIYLNDLESSRIDRANRLILKLLT